MNIIVYEKFPSLDVFGSMLTRSTLAEASVIKKGYLPEPDSGCLIPFPCRAIHMQSNTRTLLRNMFLFNQKTLISSPDNGRISPS